MLEINQFFFKVFLTLTLIIFGIFVFSNLTSDSYAVAVANDGSAYRINKRTGYIEHCSLFDTNEKPSKTFIVCFPEKNNNLNSFTRLNR